MKNPAMSRPLYEVDPQIAAAIDNEVRRQHEGLELIASENFVSEAVLEAMGSVFTNKYAEGYPGKRYYGGCEFTDVVEELARARAKQLFSAEHANVQPHAGSQANMAAYAAILQPGVCHDALHHPLAQAMTTVRFQYKHITEISISRIIGNHTSKTRLFFCMVHAEAQRVLNGRSDDLLWNPFCPVALSQKSMDYVQIQARTIGADEEISSSIL